MIVLNASLDTHQEVVIAAKDGFVSVGYFKKD